MSHRTIDLLHHGIIGNEAGIVLLINPFSIAQGQFSMA